MNIKKHPTRMTDEEYRVYMLELSQEHLKNWEARIAAGSKTQLSRKMVEKYKKEVEKYK